MELKNNKLNTTELTVQAEPIGHVPPNWADISTLAVLSLGLIVAFFQIRNHRDIEKKKAALDVIFKQECDDKLLEGMKFIRELHRSNNDNIATYAYDSNGLSDEAAEERKQGAHKITYVLNSLEYLATGVLRNIYCEDVLKDAKFSILVKVFDEAKPFIEQVRTRPKSEMTFQEFEILVKRWKKKPLVKKIKS